MNKPIQVGLAKAKTLSSNSAGLAPVKVKHCDGHVDPGQQSSGPAKEAFECQY